MRCVLYLIFILAALAAHDAQAKDKFTVSISCPKSNNCEAPEIENVLKEAYARAGHRVQFIYTPRLRDLLYANSGFTDATAVCSLEALQDHPQLKTMQTPIIQVNVCAYTLDPLIRIETPSDLATHKVGAIRGQYLAMVLAKDNALVTQEVNNIENLVAMLQKGRVDAILMSQAFAGVFLAESGITTFIESPPLSFSFLYHAVNVNKITKEEASRIDAALMDMLHDGTTQRLFSTFPGMAPTLPLPKDIQLERTE